MKEASGHCDSRQSTLYGKKVLPKTFLVLQLVTNRGLVSVSGRTIIGILFFPLDPNITKLYPNYPHGIK